MSRMLHALLRTSYHAGGLPLCDVVWGGDVKILMYHGITATARFSGVTNVHRYNVPVDDFRRQLEYLAAECNVISLADMSAARRLSRVKTNVILSFDDGYENNYAVALPLLRRYGMPAVFALPTAFVCGGQPLWNDVVEYAVNHSSRETASLPWDERRRTWSLREHCERVAFTDWLLAELVNAEQTRRDELVRQALEALDVCAAADDMYHHDDYRPLTAAQVAEMAASDLVEFASHSVHHYLLSRLGTGDRRAELSDSKRQVENLTAVRCRTLTIPGGAYDAEVLHDAFAFGYERVLTSDRRRTIPGARVHGRTVVRYREPVQKFAAAVQRRH